VTEGPRAGTVFGERKHEGSLADRAQTYDWALRQSRYAAKVRRRQGGAGSGSNSGLAPMLSSSIRQSGIGGIATAQTVVLGDSQGSEVLETGAQSNEGIPDEGLVPDGEVGSELGESYVDGAKLSKTNVASGENEDEQLDEGGVLGLLAQIYGGRGGLHT
jgi:autophagy-related protein 9